MESKKNTYIEVLVLMVKLGVCLFCPSILSDLHYYVGLALKMSVGFYPYLDFPFEYPPLASIPILFPMLMAKKANSVANEGYIFWFRLTMCMLDLGLLLFIRRKFRNSSQYIPYLLYTSLITVIMAPLIYDRYDIVFAILIFTALYFLEYANQPIKALTTSIVGVFLKLITAIFIPFLVWDILRNKKGSKHEYILQLIMPVGIIGMILVYLFGGHNFDFLTYHKARGIQIESLWSSLYQGYFYLQGQLASFYHGHGAWHLAGAPNWYMFISNYAFIGAEAVLFFRFFLQKHIKLSDVVVTSLVVFITFSKVLSPQFFIWFIPLFFFFIKEKIEMFLFAVMSLLTMMLFVRYGQFIDQASWTWPVLILRNICMVIWLGYRWKKLGTTSVPSLA